MVLNSKLKSDELSFFFNYNFILLTCDFNVKLFNFIFKGKFTDFFDIVRRRRSVRTIYIMKEY